MNRFKQLILGAWNWREQLGQVREQIVGFLGGNDWFASAQAA